MRVSFILLLFLILLNSWAGLLQAYDIDDHLGISAEVGEHEELEQAQSDAEGLQIGTGGVISSLAGVIASGARTLSNIFQGLNPAAQILANVVPSGIAKDLIAWAFGILEIIIAIDLINYARGLQ